tara:strand:- start:2690 stop:2866 length:177 start_codon:yes stop_codon:yes gene_type:complete
MVTKANPVDVLSKLINTLLSQTENEIVSVGFFVPTLAAQLLNTFTLSPIFAAQTKNNG